MKVRTQRKNNQIKPFLVLPLLEFELRANKTNKPKMPSKNPGLNLFIKTWPPKSKTKNNDSEEIKRPLTATLEKPSILDIRLVGKIDMSKIRKEFLNMSNLCRMPMLLKSPRSSKPQRPLSLPPTKRSKKKKGVSDPEDSWEDEESTRSSKLPKKQKAKLKPTDSKKTVKAVKCCDSNNNKTSKVPRRKISAVKVLGAAGNDAVSTKLPEPCKSCRRSDLPERFHSHPVTSLKPVKKMEESPKMTVKSSVQKPVAIKYKSAAKIDKKPSPLPKPTTEAKLAGPKHQQSSKTPEPRNTESKLVPKIQQETKILGLKVSEAPKIQESRAPEMRAPESRVSALKIQNPPSRVGSAKRTLTCYLCGREFGSASLPLHEPKCFQKWERENASLPIHLQRKPPPKPDSSMNREEWNKLAWEAAQSTLLPCTNCGRTFYPDRLLVHQRSCKTPQINSKVPSSEHLSSISPAMMSQNTSSTPSGAQPPPTFECYICGKVCGVHSIKIHEKLCLRRWHTENELLPPDMRSPPPVKREKIKSSEPPPIAHGSSDIDEAERPSSSRNSPLFPCYICGKLFTVNSIYIHEPQCLEKWKIENDKLPLIKRRPQPLKPDVKFTRAGKIDYDATREANWQCHLKQLIPCRNCSRTFNPDRVEIHERSCKGC